MKNSGQNNNVAGSPELDLPDWSGMKERPCFVHPAEHLKWIQRVKEWLVSNNAWVEPPRPPRVEVPFSFIDNSPPQH